MNLRDLFVPLAMAFLVTAGFNYFFRDRLIPDPSQNMQSGKSFQAPRIAYEHKPLNIEIDFDDHISTRKEVLTIIETTYAHMTFSNNGAILQNLEFERRVDGNVVIVPTIEPTEREQSTFMLALEQQTPYYYTFVNKREHEDTIVLTYSAKTDQVDIEKVFTVYKNIPQIDLAIQLRPKGDHEIQSRLFIAQPMVRAIESSDIIQGLTNKEGSLNGINKIQKTFDMTRRYWVMPNFFGLEDRYFVHAMIKDPQRFTHRAYFVNVNDVASAIFEGPIVKNEGSWNLSFFMGPKESDVFALVDPRLDQTLDYGWFTPICKALLGILQWLYQYVHNYGWGIIILTMMIKLILMPFTMRGEKSIQEGQKKQQELQRKIQLIRQKYKDNPQLRAKEEAELIRKNGVPGAKGLVTMLITAPFMIALARITWYSILLYKAPFLWIPDLSARDPFYILPLIVILATVAAARMRTDQQSMGAIIMAFVLGAVTSVFSAGFALYIAVNSIMALFERWIINFFSI
jgi:YidC/Oxa1 family membrane protein insertase